VVRWLLDSFGSVDTERRPGDDPSQRAVQRPNTTFKPRRRALSEKRQGELEQWIEHWGLDQNGPMLDWSELFGDLPVVLDIGFGRGEGTIDMARADAATAIVGIEVHTTGVAAVLDAVENDPLPHVRVVHGDVLRFLTRVPAASLHGVRVYFPDPWPKKRHHGRRLVRPDVVSVLVDRLAIGGTLHLATDIEHYASEMSATCDNQPGLDGGTIDRPDWRPLTRFEQRGLDEGRPPTDLLYTRVD
jgi:tRNA (guanine-N7-)-methyltransferase